MKSISFTYIVPSMPASPLNESQLADAARLKRIFEAWQKTQRAATPKLPSSQEFAAEKLGFGQSALNQYLNGQIPLNVNAAIRLADFLGCSVSDFSGALAAQAAKYATAASDQAPGSRTPKEARLRGLYRLLDQTRRDRLLEYADDLLMEQQNEAVGASDVDQAAKRKTHAVRIG